MHTQHATQGWTCVGPSMGWVGFKFFLRLSWLGWVRLSDSVVLGSNRLCAFIFSKSEMEVTALSRTQQYDTKSTRMWVNAQPDGRPAEHRWRPLFNAAKFG